MKAQIRSRKNPQRTDLVSATPLKTPYVVFVDPSSACNFRCTFCPTGDRKLIRDLGRFQGSLSLADFEKVLTDIEQFDDPIKVLRLYKDGEPLMNRNLAQMVRMARGSSAVETIDTTTNGSLLRPAISDELLEAGIDLINISVDGLDAEQMFHFTGMRLDFDSFIANLAHLYRNRGKAKVVIKTTQEIIGVDRKAEFFDTFGNICDLIYIENTSPCWPDFDVEDRMGITIETGLYGNEISEQTACPYLFYSISVNSDMKVSACFVDWSRALLVGDLRIESLREVWDGGRMLAHRTAHLDGRRTQHPTCGQCGQISHCGPDSIEDGLDTMREKYTDLGLMEVGRQHQELVGYRSSIDLPVIED